MIEECVAVEQNSVVLFCGQKHSMQIIFIKKCFLFTMGSVLDDKRFTIASRNILKIEEVERMCGSG
jgi:hypothetical protein